MNLQIICYLFLTIWTWKPQIHQIYICISASLCKPENANIPEKNTAFHAECIYKYTKCCQSSTYWEFLNFSHDRTSYSSGLKRIRSMYHGTYSWMNMQKNLTKGVPGLKNICRWQNWRDEKQSTSMGRAKQRRFFSKVY